MQTRRQKHSTMNPRNRRCNTLPSLFPPPGRGFADCWRPLPPASFVELGFRVLATRNKAGPDSHRSSVKSVSQSSSIPLSSEINARKSIRLSTWALEETCRCSPKEEAADVRQVGHSSRLHLCHRTGTEELR